jgi:hypothetical protein
MTTVARQPRSDKTFIGNKVNTNSIAFTNMMRKIDIIVLDTNIINENKAEQILEIKISFQAIYTCWISIEKFREYNRIS